jgi:sterol desaturase/sphingolipid hydroxylase (fatty acid hydroxylase superfamily)
VRFDVHSFRSSSKLFLLANMARLRRCLPDHGRHSVLDGTLIAYAWYLSVHYCAHDNPAILPASLLKHHLDHHKFARRNYGVTTKVWDRLFGTCLDEAKRTPIEW